MAEKGRFHTKEKGKKKLFQENAIWTGMYILLIFSDLK